MTIRKDRYEEGRLRVGARVVTVVRGNNTRELERLPGPTGRVIPIAPLGQNMDRVWTEKVEDNATD